MNEHLVTVFSSSKNPEIFNEFRSLDDFLHHSFEFDKMSELDPPPNSVFLVDELLLTENVITFLAEFAKICRTIPLVLVGSGYSQEYLAELFPERPFSYVSPDVGNVKLKQSVIDICFETVTAIQEHEFERELNLIKEDIKSLHEVGVALSAENDLDKLLEIILTQSRKVTSADAGSLYLVEPGNKLRFKLSQNLSLDWDAKQNMQIPIDSSSICGYVAESNKGINLLDAYRIPDSFPFHFNRSFDENSGYRSKSVLALPMRNHEGEILGVLQLLNKRKDYPEGVRGKKLNEQYIQPFSHEEIELLNSLASQAAVAIDNTRLYQDIKNLFEGFVRASVSAIESRDLATKGHSERVAELTVSLANEVTNMKNDCFSNINFDDRQITELRYASLLHDFGKVGVREEILIKAKKLFPHELEILKSRFRYIQKSIEADFYRECLDYIIENGIDKFNLMKSSLEAGFQAKTQEIWEILEFLIDANEPSVLEQGNFNKLLEIAKMQHIDLDNQITPFLTEREMHVLGIRRGSLSEQERIEIESHVTHTFNFLSKIPWTRGLERVPEIAYAHHEKLNGRGYPNHLQAGNIPIESQIMAVSDIFDALTASDRPYKKAVPLKKAIDILYFDVKSEHINKDLVDLFVNKQIYRVIEGRSFK